MEEEEQFWRRRMSLGGREREREREEQFGWRRRRSSSGEKEGGRVVHISFM